MVQRRKQQCLEKKRKANCGLTDYAVKLAASVYYVSGYDLDLAERVGQVLLKRQAKVGRRSEHTGPLPIREWFSTIPIERFDAVLSPVSAADHHLVRECQKLISEVRTMRWVRDQNFDRGVAPPSADVANRFAEAMSGFGQTQATEALQRSAASASRNGQRTLRQWAHRFRKRWGATHSHMSTQDAPPRAAQRDKAGLQRVPRPCFRFYPSSPRLCYGNHWM